jgi:hypothetical protein
MLDSDGLVKAMERVWGRAATALAVASPASPASLAKPPGANFKANLQLSSRLDRQTKPGPDRL